MKTTNGFTLAEMLIALVLVGIIAAMVIPQLLFSIQGKIARSKVQSTVAAVENSIQALSMNGALGSGVNAQSWSAALILPNDGALNGRDVTQSAYGCGQSKIFVASPVYGSNAKAIDLKSDTEVVIYSPITGSSSASTVTVNGPEDGSVNICIDPYPSSTDIHPVYVGAAKITPNGGTAIKFDWTQTDYILGTNALSNTPNANRVAADTML